MPIAGTGGRSRVNRRQKLGQSSGDALHLWLANYLTLALNSTLYALTPEPEPLNPTLQTGALNPSQGPDRR